ncbi:MAG: NADH-quinone oxidoreductase subunit N [Candidatus Binatia bacterium]|nr:MAG: NADH-quinone oxidoreductase subunit N [Candidatus Binatia bacterium]
MTSLAFPDVSWIPLLPLLVVTGTAVLVLIADLFSEGPDYDALGWIGLIGLVLAVGIAVPLWNQSGTTMAGVLALDRYGLFFTVLFCLGSGLTLLLSMNYLETTDIRCGDYYTLILFSTVGMILMAMSVDLIVIFLGLEVMSIAAYALAGIWRTQVRSNEAALKYFVLGAFASGFLLLGIALLFGASGETLLPRIAESAAPGSADQRMLLVAGAALLLVGFGFKVAAAPFHSWAPDVYEGAPTAVTAFMAAGIKAAAFAAFVRIFVDTLSPLAADWRDALWVLAVLTMSVGNFSALVQRNIKRLLAYSSIAHAGYLLVGMVAGGEGGGAAVLFYLAVYTLMTVGAFAVVIALGRRGQPNEDLDDWAGVGLRNPFLGFAMTVFMLSLAGVPPLAGFMGKFYLFSAALDAGYVWLTVIAVLNSLVSVYYYVGVLVKMYMTEGGAEVEAPMARPYLFAALLATVAGTIVVGLFPTPWFELARRSMESLV